VRACAHGDRLRVLAVLTEPKPGPVPRILEYSASRRTPRRWRARETRRTWSPLFGRRCPLQEVALALARVSQAVGWCGVCILKGLAIDIGHHGQTLAAH